jgi:hypothetical protein
MARFRSTSDRKRAMHEIKKSADAWNRSSPPHVSTLGLGNEEAAMRKESGRPTATIHPFPVRPKAKVAETAARSGSVACFDSWYHDEAIQEEAVPAPGRDPLPPVPRLRPV